MKIQIIFVAATLFIGFSALAQAQGNTPDLGKKIDVLVKDGHPQFGAQIWTNGFSSTFSVLGNDLAAGKNVTDIAVRYVNQTTGEILSNWKAVYHSPSQPIARDAIEAFSPALSDKESAKVLKALRSSALLIVVTNQGEPMVSGYIDIASYCNTAPKQFLNVETGDQGCPK